MATVLWNDLLFDIIRRWTTIAPQPKENMKNSARVMIFLLTCYDIKTRPKKTAPSKTIFQKIIAHSHIFPLTVDLIYIREGGSKQCCYTLAPLSPDFNSQSPLNAERSDIAISHGFNPHGADWLNFHTQKTPTWQEIYATPITFQQIFPLNLANVYEILAPAFSLFYRFDAFGGLVFFLLPSILNINIHIKRVFSTKFIFIADLLQRNM